MTPLVSVVICTHNRAESLARSIDSVVDQSSDDPFEVIVVDNGSTDATESVVRRFSDCSFLRYAREPVLGLSRARNLGRALARGRYIAYLDDDAIALAGWVRAIPQAFAVAPRVAVAGGRVDPIWDTSRPAWLSDDLAMGLAVVNWSLKPKLLCDIDREWLVGANVAFDAEVLDELGGFDVALGRSGTRLLTGEEIVLQRRAIEKGYACVYYPEMHVHHAIDRARIHKRWFRRRYFWQGVSNAVMELSETSPSPLTRLRLGVIAAGRVLGDRKKLRGLLTNYDDPEAFTRHTFLLTEVGHALGLLGVARRSM
jgi:glycosyltransferase involved in cell wall biosynthesis